MVSISRTAAPWRAAARRTRAGVWRLADPRISLASMASIFLGAAAAAAVLKRSVPAPPISLAVMPMICATASDSPHPA